MTRSVPPAVLAATINRLEEVNLWSCNLTKTQVNNLITTIVPPMTVGPELIEQINDYISLHNCRCWNCSKKCPKELP